MDTDSSIRTHTNNNVGIPNAPTNIQHIPLVDEYTQRNLYCHSSGHPYSVVSMTKPSGEGPRSEDSMAHDLKPTLFAVCPGYPRVNLITRDGKNPDSEIPCCNSLYGTYMWDLIFSDVEKKYVPYFHMDSKEVDNLIGAYSGTSDGKEHLPISLQSFFDKLCSYLSMRDTSGMNEDGEVQHLLEKNYNGILKTFVSECNSRWSETDNAQDCGESERIKIVHGQKSNEFYEKLPYPKPQLLKCTVVPTEMHELLMLSCCKCGKKAHPFSKNCSMRKHFSQYFRMCNYCEGPFHMFSVDRRKVYLGLYAMYKKRVEAHYKILSFGQFNHVLQMFKGSLRLYGLKIPDGSVCIDQDQTSDLNDFISRYGVEFVDKLVDRFHTKLQTLGDNFGVLPDWDGYGM